MITVGLHTPHSLRINNAYMVQFWALVYATTPSYALSRGDLNREVLPIEREAEEAAINLMLVKGVLER